MFLKCMYLKYDPLKVNIMFTFSSVTGTDKIIIKFKAGGKQIKE